MVISWITPILSFLLVISVNQISNSMQEVLPTENSFANQSTEYEYVEVEDISRPEDLPELCALPENRGTCYGSQLRYRFDPETDQCIGFVYSGCRKNSNNFRSMESCERACGQWRNTKVCDSKVERGECLESNVTTLKWYFDPEKKKCNFFMWSGCGGNGNRFSSNTECENLCTREMDSINKGINLCHFLYDSGPCDDYIEQWYYDSGTNGCRRFTWGGCRGNSNRFNTKLQCETACPTQSPYFENPLNFFE